MGEDPNSHFGVANVQFQQLQPQRTLESFYSPQGDAAVSRQVEKTIKRFFNSGPYAAAQRQFDQDDTPQVFALGCDLDFTETESSDP